MSREVLYALVRQFEGLHLKAYICPAGVPTIGYGSTGKDIKLGMVWTREQCEARMAADCEVFYRGTAALCPQLRGPALGAIASFAYNCGLTRLAGSTLRKRLNAGDIEGAKLELMKWTRGGGRVLNGLVARRKAEALLL